MNNQTTRIEGRLQAAGYRTQRDGNGVLVLDPVYVSKPYTKGLTLSHHTLVPIHDICQAMTFIDERS